MSEGRGQQRGNPDAAYETPPGRFVGRAAELSSLHSEIEAAANGPCRAVVLTGDTGVGKTRLVSEFVRRAPDRGHSVLFGGCMPLHGDMLPYAPLWDAVVTLNRRCRESIDESALAELTTHLETMGDPETGSRPGTHDLPRVVGTTRHLERLCAHRRLVLVVEDLHWSDPSTRALLTFLLRTGRPRGALVVGTFRDDELTRCDPIGGWLSEFELFGARRLPITALGPEPATAVVRSLLGAGADSERARRIVDRGGGNPLALEQLCLATTGLDEVPPSLSQTLMSRVLALGTGPRPVLEVIAVAGGRIGHELLAAVSEPDERCILARLRLATEHHLLLFGTGGDDYQFRHPLLGEVLYAAMPAGERRRAHRALASALARDPDLSRQRGAGRWAEIVHHFDAGGDRESALAAALRAGLAAEAVSAVAESRRHFERAERLWELVQEVPEALPLDRDELRGHLAEVTYLDGDAPAAVSWVRLVLDRLDPANARVRAGILYERLGRYLWAAGHSGNENIDACRRAVELVPERSVVERAQVLASLGQALMLATRFAESADHCRAALELAETGAIPHVHAHALITLGVDESMSGDPACGTDLLRRAREVADAHGSAEDRLRARGNLGFVLALNGRRREAVEVLLPAVELARQWGMEDSNGAFLLSNTVGVLFLLGRWDEADEHLEQLAVGRGSARAVASLHVIAARIRAARGEFHSARERLLRAEEVLRGRGDAWVSSQLLVGRAELACWRHDHAGARQCVWEAISLHAEDTADNELKAQTAVPLLQAEADRRRTLRNSGQSPDEDDRRAVAGLIDLVRPLEGQRLSTMAAAYLANCRAETTRLEGRSAPASWRSLAERWKDQDNLHGLAYARWQEAEALLDGGKGDRRRASRCMVEAHDIAERLQMEPMLSGIRRLGADAGIDLPRPESRPVHKNVDVAGPRTGELSRRQREVLGMIANGATNKQIAAELYISEKTVSIHVSRVLARLGATNRAQAAAVAHRDGLV